MSIYSQPDQAQALSEYPMISPVYGEFKFICAKYAIRRSKLYDLIKGGYVKSKRLITLNDQGVPKSRGRIVIEIASLEDYLYYLPNGNDQPFQYHPKPKS